MSDFEKQLDKLLQDRFIGMDDLKEFIDSSINDNRLGKVNQLEFVRLLPKIIKGTNELNFSWLGHIKDYSHIPGFLDSFIEHVFLINYDEYQFLFLSLMADFRILPIRREHVRLLMKKVLDYKVKINYDSIFYMLKDVFPDMIPEMLLFFIQYNHSCSDVIDLFTKDKGIYLPLLYSHIDTVLEHIHGDKLFYLKDIVKDNKTVYEYVVDTIKLGYKKNMEKLIKSMYMRVVITHSYYHDLSYVQDDKFQNILEIIYLIIEDVCRNENVDISDVHNIGCGSYSSVLSIGSKVVKIGLSRVTPSFPNNPYVNAMLLRKEFSINDNESIFVEVNEKVDSNDKVSDEELYQLYKKLRDINLFWLDVAKRNVGRLIKDNQASWRFPLPLTDEVLGLETFRGNETLKKGDIVILDNDVIYDGEKILKYQFSSTHLQKEFQKRYLLEKEIHNTVEN